MKEVWKDIEGYEGLYQVSNLGRIKSLERDIIRKNNRSIHINEKILSASKNLKGYLFVNLKNCNNRDIKYIHRLVGECFIPNPQALPQINHKDENKNNNCVTNLEWCTNSYNCNYGTHNERLKKTLSKQINQFNKNGKFIKTWFNSGEASKSLKIDRSHIINCCNGKRKTAGGYMWKYK